MSNIHKSINPYNGDLIKSYKLNTSEEIKTILTLADSTYQSWKNETIKHRTECLKQLADNLERKKQVHAKLMTAEMGKPITESVAEIDKCIWLTKFYIVNAEQFLSDVIIKTEANESFISKDPLGCILGIMPWNYPFWQVLRFAIPTVTAGNTVILKHANNVSGCALSIQELFESSEFPKGCFQTILTEHETIEQMISNPIIKAISLTGSEKAGKAIAQIAGKHLKKTVLELGGNNACIVLKDADLNKYLDVMVKARMQNTGQSCIAAKRFIVVEDIYEEFVEKFKTKVKSLKFGDPLEKDTQISTMARPDLAKSLKEQVDKSVEQGAKVLIGNTYKNAYFAPTIIIDVRPEMPVFAEETFGPVAAIIKAKDADEAFKMASETTFGLGTMVFTNDIKKAAKRTIEIQDGAFFINEMVKSDPRLPFGGTKNSGYGRELSREGMLEFVNKKTVYINT